MIPKVIFQIDPEKEYQYLQLFNSTPGLSNLSVFNFSDISDHRRIIKKINSFWDDTDKKVVKNIEAQWQTIETEYFKQIKKITGVDWLYPKYYAYFMAFSSLIGFSNPFNLRSQEIVLTTGAQINPCFIIGHELFHSHYYYLVEKMGLTTRLNQTIFTEGVAALALFETTAKKLFSDTDSETSIDSYPEVRAKWPILLEHWRRRRNFNNFLTEISQDNRL